MGCTSEYQAETVQKQYVLMKFWNFKPCEQPVPRVTPGVSWKDMTAMVLYWQNYFVWVKSSLSVLDNTGHATIEMYAQLYCPNLCAGYFRFSCIWSCHQSLAENRQCFIEFFSNVRDLVRLYSVYCLKTVPHPARVASISTTEPPKPPGKVVESVFSKSIKKPLLSLCDLRCQQRLKPWRFMISAVFRWKCVDSYVQRIFPQKNFTTQQL